jgi:hypothetical protein
MFRDARVRRVSSDVTPRTSSGGRRKFVRLNLIGPHPALLADRIAFGPATGGALEQDPARHEALAQLAIGALGIVALCARRSELRPRLRTAGGGVVAHPASARRIARERNADASPRGVGALGVGGRTRAAAWHRSERRRARRVVRGGRARGRGRWLGDDPGSTRAVRQDVASRVEVVTVLAGQAEVRRARGARNGRIRRAERIPAESRQTPANESVRGGVAAGSRVVTFEGGRSATGRECRVRGKHARIHESSHPRVNSNRRAGARAAGFPLRAGPACPIPAAASPPARPEDHGPCTAQSRFSIFQSRARAPARRARRRPARHVRDLQGLSGHDRRTRHTTLPAVCEPSRLHLARKDLRGRDDALLFVATHEPSALAFS